MAKRLSRIERDIERLKEKISEYQQQLKELEEENLICMYHTSDRRRTMTRMLTALPDMDTEMRRLVNETIAKLERMTDADFDGQRFDFTGE